MLVSVKAGECPTPQQGITTWRCESDGECEGALKCCREDQGQLCRHPLYVTRFQVDVTLNAPWKNIYNNVDSVLMMNLRDRLHDHFADLKSFMGLTLLLAASGSVKVSVEVVASPEVSREDVQQTVTSLRGKQVRFDNVVRLVSSASLVTHEFCGSQDCGGGSCVSTTHGAKCLCSQGLYGDRCQFSNICMAGLCQNGGTCVGTGTIGETAVDYQFSCLCGPGFMGDTCEVSVCDQLPTELCNSGTCLGDLTGGALCSCPLDRRGIFCQDNGTEMPYTECELRKRLNNYIADVLKGKTTIAGMNMNGVKNLLLSLGVEWLPLLTCQHGGAYTLTAEVLSVTDRSTTRHICLDRHGEEEVDCQSKVCSTLGTICQNNGTCVGNINLQLCHCAGTGHHGAVCDKPGEGEPTDCQQRHDLAQLTLDALSGNLEVKGMTSQTVKTTITSLLSDIHRDKFWQPDCTKGGSHAYRGCEFGVPDITSKTCFCVDDMNERLDGTPTSSSGLPECPVAGACSEFSSEPCGAHGKCVGDLNAGALCECDQDYSGTMCQVNSPDTLTDCQRRGRLANYLLSIMSGYGQPPPELSGTVQQLLSRAGMTRLEVPTCGGDGFYRYTCTYTVDSLVLDGCRCTNDDGTYTGDEASCDVLEKPGECPETEPATPGVPQMECESDNRCNDSQKCCPVGSGRQCLDPVLVSTFQVNVTVNAPYSQFSSARADLLTQLGDVFGTLPGFIAVTIVQATQGSIKLTVKVKAAMDVTAADIDNTLNRLRAAQFTLTSSTLYDVTSVVFVAGGACEDVQCGAGVCVDTSYGARCVCPVGTSGNMCQYSMLPCNCSAGQQCVRGTHQDTLACSCYPQNDATCRMPLWFCDGKADCRVSEKCVHREDCDVVKNGDCDVKSRCIPLSESEACDSQPCQHGALCVTKNDGSYRCQCQQGFSGSHCEENVGVCNVVPDKVCTHGCVGDAHVGVLCQCPHGRGGINCDQPAHSPCEQQHALFSDVLNISKSSLSVPGVTQTQLYNMMTQIMTHIDAQDLPLTNCTSDGGFSPVQCKVNLRSQAETCHCVNQDGTPISSNVLAYPGFPACTAPYSPELAGEMLCSTTLSDVCRNGGRCVGNLLNGTLCQCDPGYSGILCQDRAGSGQPASLPRSLCEISLAVWQLMQRSLTSGDRSLMTELYRLQDKLFHASTNLPSQMIKASCAQDGHFQHVQCVYNLRTDSPVACYCINPRGVVLHSRTAWPAKPDCDEIDSCPKPACSLTDCEHGLAQDIHGCDVCQCKHPCDGECDHDPGMRCVVEKQEECGRDSWEGACTSGVCRKREKSGMCPASVSANMTSLDTLKSGGIASCYVTCLDDADCPANLKCCGVCGMQCVQPVDHTCDTHSTSATQEHQYLKNVKAAVQKGHVNLNAASRILRAKLQSIKAMTATWIPACDASGFYRLTQCRTSLTNGATAGCFCVDRHGNHIPGTNAATRAGTNCEAKPGLCPFLQPNATTNHDCDSDYDCHDNNKCCPHGLGSVCVPPVKELGSAISLDHVIDGACSFAANECGIRGACVRRWFTEGRVCACNSGSRGVFCQISGSEPGDMTACKRRKEMQDYLLDNPRKLDIFLARARKEFGNNRPFKLTFPECLADGSFAPTQCNRNLDSRQVVDCYCVDTNGKPLEGTHVEGDQTPVCARQNPCDVGAPLHHLGNQTAVTCGGQAGKCVPGYVCQAGRYARLYCCRDRLSDVDVCILPPTPGHDCPFFEGGAREVTEQRFYFDAVAKQCRALTYRGCAGFKSNFPTLASCEARCVKKVHQGRCPTRTVVAERAVCTDACRSDADCQESHKCCSTSCGRRCVFALNSEDEVCEVGEAVLDTELSQPRRCSEDLDCGAAYRCTGNVCCLRRVENVCQQPKVEGPCKASLSRYHYNPATKQCERFVYGGCGANDNSFLTRDDCCNACAEKGRCKDGVCPAPRPVLSMSCDHSCYGDGDCPTNQICCNSSCGGSACVIAEPSTESTVSCTDALANYHQRLAQAKGCFLTYEPRCDQYGRWESEQCSDRLGVCWCVSHNGFVVPGTRVRGVAQCQWVTPAMMVEADKKGLKGDDTSNTEQCQVCPGGEEVSCCDQDLCLQVCAADPSATCRVNPCGGCSAVFYNADNNVVNCEQGLTDCQLRRQGALLARYKYGVVSMATEIRSQKMVPGTRMAGSDKGQVPYIVDGVPSKCQLLPDTGTCRAHVTQWFYNVTSQRCEVFVYGLCGGNENRFHTVDECYEHCNPEASPCFAVPCKGKVCQVSHTQNCFSGHCGQAGTCGANNGDHVVRDVYVPQCTNNGGYSLRQCHDHLCWCVMSDGSYNQGLTSDITSLQCTLQGPVTDGKAGAGEPVECPSNTSSARVECMDRCKDAVCPGHPDARCVIDLCACQSSFVGQDGRLVVCKGDACQTDVFTRAEKNCPSDKVCEGVGPQGCEYSDPCRTAVCSANPCAVCVSDPCTGLVSYMDTLTGKQVKQQDCNKVTHTHCELRKCEVVSMNTRASHNDTLLPLPQCHDDGSYLPQQRRADNTLYCVDDFGEPVESETSECVKDPLVRVTVAVIYEGDFDTIVPGREGKITVAFQELLVKIGLLRAMITNVKVSRGSIVLETDIVDHPDSPMELAVVKPLIQSKAASGELTLRVDGITLTVARGEEGGVVVTPTTASQVQSQPVDQGGLGAGGVAAIVIVLIIIAAVGGGAAFYFLYYKRRQPKPADSGDSMFHAPKAGQSKGTVEGVDNNAFDMHDSGKRGEDYADHYVKVRL